MKSDYCAAVGTVVGSLLGIYYSSQRIKKEDGLARNTVVISFHGLVFGAVGAIVGEGLGMMIDNGNIVILWPVIPSFFVAAAKHYN